MPEINRSDVPVIEATEPVYPTADHTCSVWVTCQLEWYPERGRFIPRDADEEWVLDDHAFPDSTYVVDGETYTSLDDARRAALGDALYEQQFGTN